MIQTVCLMLNKVSPNSPIFPIIWSVHHVKQVVCAVMAVNVFALSTRRHITVERARDENIDPRSRAQGHAMRNKELEAQSHRIDERQLCTFQLDVCFAATLPL